MNFKQLQPTSVVHSLAALLFVATVSLFAYEFSKPDFNTTATSAVVCKMSPFSPQALGPEQVHPLPALTERFQHKLLVYEVRYKALKPWQPEQPGKNFVKTGVTRKAYMAMNHAVSAEDDNNQ